MKLETRNSIRVYPGNQPTLEPGPEMVPAFFFISLIRCDPNIHPNNSDYFCRSVSWHEQKNGCDHWGFQWNWTILRISDERAGWLVFATVRKASDRDRLRHEKNVYPVMMDMQDASSVRRLPKRLHRN